MPNMLHQLVPFLSAISVQYDKWIFPFFFRNHGFVVYESVAAVCRKNTRKTVIFVWIIDVFQGLFNLKIAYSLAHFFVN